MRQIVKTLNLVESKRETIISFLQKLISFPSTTGNEGQIQEFLAKKLKGLGLTVDVWEPNLQELKRHPAYTQVESDFTNRPNVVGVYKGTGDGRSLLFNGHVDVIEAGSLKSWKHNPWSGDIEEGRIYGRGASDMKSGLTAMTMATALFLEAGFRPKGDIILEYVVDEELTGHGTLACVLRGYAADAGICAETSDLCVQPAAIGRMWFEIEVRGKPAGLTRRWEAISAIDKGYMICRALDNLEQIRIDELKHPLYPDTRGALPCYVGVFEAGQFPSATPDRCVLKGSMATLPGEDSKKAQQQLIDYVQNLAKADPWLRKNPPEVRFYGLYAEPVEIPADHPICSTVSKAFKKVTGRDAIVSGREGAADTRFLIPYSRTPTVIFGPGSTSQMHATNEWVSIEDLMTATKVMILTLLDWCGVR